jgi:hypothetical protein
MLLDLDLPIHPRTGLQAVGIVGGKPVWPIKGGAEDAGDGAGDGGAGAGDGGNAGTSTDGAGDDKGYPPNTPWRDMTAPQQVAYWQAQSRQHESRVKAMGDYDTLKDKASQYDALADSVKTEQDRAVEAAKAEGKAAALQEAAPELVASAFDAAAARAGLSEAQATALLEDLAFANFLTADGKVDRAKVTAKVAAFAPTAAPRPPTLLGQGRTPTDVKPSVASGADLFNRSRKRTA